MSLGFSASALGTGGDQPGLLCFKTIYCSAKLWLSWLAEVGLCLLALFHPFLFDGVGNQCPY